MRAKEFIFETTLFESRGLGGRVPGDRFISDDPNSPELFFQDIQFSPKQGRFDSFDEMMAAVEEYENQWGSPTWVNKPNQGTGGFGIITLTDNKGNEHHYGKFFKEIKPVAHENSWSNKGGIPGYQFDSKVAKKEAAGLRPTEILTSLDNLSSQDIIAQLAQKFGAKSPLTQVAKQIEAGVQFPIKVNPVDDMDITAFSNYFCEILHPIALQSGVFTGNAHEAETTFLGSSGFESTSISFGNSKTEGLSDSILTSPDGFIIKVSSKAGSGASASVKNLADALEDIKRSGNHKLLAKLKSTMDLIQFVQEGSARSTPIALAEHFGIINSKEADQVRELQTSNIPFAMVFNGEANLSRKLQGIFNGRLPKDTSQANSFYHMITSLMYLVADHVNIKTNFGIDAAKILSNAALIQVHTKAVEQGGKWVIQAFETRYPGNFDVNVVLDPTKSYASTNIKGNVTFKILKAGQKARQFYVKSSPAAVKDMKEKLRVDNISAANPKGTLSKGPKGATGRKKQ